MENGSELPPRIIRILITNYKLSKNLMWFYIEDDTHYTILSTDVNSVKYLVLTNKKGSNTIDGFDINVDMNDTFNFAVEILPFKLNELVLSNYKTRFQIEDFDKFKLKATKYFLPPDLKKSIVSFLNFHRVFRVIGRYLFHMIQNQDNYWVPCMLATISNEVQLDYLTVFDFNGVTLITKFMDRPLYIFDAKNNFNVNYSGFIESKKQVRLILGFVDDNYLVEKTEIPNTLPLVTVVDKNSYLKSSELDAQSWIVKIFRDVKIFPSDVAQYAIYNPIEEKAFLNRFTFDLIQHNFNYISPSLPILKEDFEELLEIPSGLIIISDIEFVSST